MGLHKPFVSNAGVMTSGIHFSANMSVQAMCEAVATVKRIGVKCDMRLSCRDAHRTVTSRDRVGCSCAGSSCSKCDVVATL